MAHAMKKSVVDLRPFTERDDGFGKSRQWTFYSLCYVGYLGTVTRVTRFISLNFAPELASKINWFQTSIDLESIGHFDIS